MFFILPTIKTPMLALLYILIFGIGSIGGMMAMSFLVGLPIHFTANRFEFLNRGIRLVAGVFSLGLGAMIVFGKLIAA
jgi:sulfite exporter TauE/SafE